jgi:hypothetical protein
MNITWGTFVQNAVQGKTSSAKPLKAAKKNKN